MCRIAAHYSVLPHVVAALPYTYWSVIRFEWLRQMGLIRRAEKKSDQPYEVEYAGNPEAWSDLR